MADGAPPRFPDVDEVIRFLTERPDLPIHDAARLLGWPASRLVEKTREELLPGGLVAWSEVAYWLVAVWPRATLLAKLGEAAVLIPRGLHLMPVPWELPTYIVRALEVQARLHREREDGDVHDVTAGDLVADLLHMALDDETVAALRDDPEFLAAYHYPEES